MHVIFRSSVFPSRSSIRPTRPNTTCVYDCFVFFVVLTSNRARVICLRAIYIYTGSQFALAQYLLCEEIALITVT